MTKNSFQQIINAYYTRSSRSFPWRETSDPYLILVSELMLQQTQTHRVLPKYKLFVDRFPSIEALSQADLAEVLTYWQGLGYNRRAKYLSQISQIVVQSYNGTVPQEVETLESLPGIGPYTAKAVATFAYNQPHVFVETNIRTVYLHFFFKGQSQVSDTLILEKVAATLDKK